MREPQRKEVCHWGAWRVEWGTFHGLGYLTKSNLGLGVHPAALAAPVVRIHNHIFSHFGANFLILLVPARTIVAHFTDASGLGHVSP